MKLKFNSKYLVTDICSPAYLILEEKSNKFQLPEAPSHPSAWMSALFIVVKQAKYLLLIKITISPFFLPSNLRFCFRQNNFFFLFSFFSLNFLHQPYPGPKAKSHPMKIWILSIGNNLKWGRNCIDASGGDGKTLVLFC